jgi:hypothetical protein
MTIERKKAPGKDTLVEQPVVDTEQHPEQPLTAVSGLSINGLEQLALQRQQALMDAATQLDQLTDPVIFMNDVIDEVQAMRLKKHQSQVATVEAVNLSQLFFPPSMSVKALSPAQ